MFLVVEDQLRVSEGWVRCGRCTNVFNAIDDLIDVDHGTPVALDLEQLRGGHRADGDNSDAGGDDADARREPRVMAGVATPTDSLAQLPMADHGLAAARAAVRAEPHGPMGQHPHADVDLDELAAEAPGADSPPVRDPWHIQPPHGAPPSRSARPQDGFELPDQWLRAPSRSNEAPTQGRAALDPERQGTDARPSVWSSSLPPEPSGLPTAAPPETDPALAVPATEPPPSFVRQAEREARWRQPHVKAALGLATVVAALVLAAQLALLWRDTLAAHLPAAAPALQALCAPLGCQVQPLRRIEQISVDSSGLIRVGDETDATDHRYRFNLVLRNRAETALLAPAIELTLTDPRGEVAVRRVLQTTELGAAIGPLPAGQEWPLRAVLATGAQRIEGYTVEIFYP